MANPPVCRIMDFGKFKFDEAQRAKESRRKAVHVGIKEMKYRPKIGPGDFDTKTRQVAKFLDDGHKVKLTIMFRGREVFHPELGKRILDRVAETLGDAAKIEFEPRLDGRNMVMVLAPDKRARQSAAARATRQPSEGPAAVTSVGTSTVRRRADRGATRPAEVQNEVATSPPTVATRQRHQGKSDHAEDEDRPRCGQADQGHRDRAAAPSQGVPVAPLGEEAEHPDAAARARDEHRQVRRAPGPPDAGSARDTTDRTGSPSDPGEVRRRVQRPGRCVGTTARRTSRNDRTEGGPRWPE